MKTLILINKNKLIAGVTAVEYGLIAALVATVSIVTFTTIGNGFSAALAQISSLI